MNQSELTGRARVAAAFTAQFKQAAAAAYLPAAPLTSRERAAAEMAAQFRRTQQRAEIPSAVVVRSPTAVSGFRAVLGAKACASYRLPKEEIRRLIQSRAPCDHVDAIEAIKALDDNDPDAMDLLNLYVDRCFAVA